MNKTYSPFDIEQQCYQKWEQKGYFSARGHGENFCIMLPPPNVTGSLHMGHGFQHTLMDALTRYHRMRGDNTLWQPGTDHAGISTQMVVERQIEAEGLNRASLGREAFVDKIWQWKETTGNEITKQIRRMGSSVDWTRERFTMDEGLSEAVKKVFVQLHDEGLIYRGKRLVNWDPVLKTAVSDLEVLSVEEQGSLWHIRYPIADSDESLVIATTRPETLLGDTAVAVHPDDERYSALIGKEIALPLCNRRIPIIADSYVDKAFGTGCVKITPAHDFNDNEMGKRHALPCINILNKDATINEAAPAAYRNLDRFIARKKIIVDLEQLGLLVKTEAHTLKVPRGEKSNAVIEPLLTEQWYVSVKSLAEPAIAAVKNGDIQFVPENWDKTYFQWMDNIEDWCISRQLWWGHRIPAWYDDAGEVYVGYSEQDVRFKHQLSDTVLLRQDEDVLDTWFSSALWPFTTLGWPDSTAELEQFYPSSVLVTGFDIIFFWVARMIMMGIKFVGKVPFKKVYITGLIRDAEGKKMSKSKGNVLDPIDLIDGIGLDELLAKRTSNLMLGSAAKSIIKQTKKEYPEGIAAYGTDALRFTFCALATTGRDIRFDMGRIEGYRNFCNKLWNAARFVLQQTEHEDDDWGDRAFQYSASDTWILSRLQKTIEQAHDHFEQFRFDLLAQCLYEFVWHEYCDWYLELSKPVLYNANALVAAQRGTKKTLLHVLEQTLRLLHPLMPFITEEIWQRVSCLTSQTGETIMTRPYPTVDSAKIAPDVELGIEWLKQVIQGIRTIRGEMNISPNKPIPVFLNHGTDSDKSYLSHYRELLLPIAKLSDITWLSADETAPAAATALVGKMEVLIPLAGLIDIDAESVRLTKEMDKLKKDLLRTEGKLNNTSFVAKAPAAVLAKEQSRQNDMSQALATLEQQLAQLKKL